MENDVCYLCYNKNLKIYLEQNGIKLKEKYNKNCDKYFWEVSNKDKEKFKELFFEWKNK